jgi:hypothetical protein
LVSGTDAAKKCWFGIPAIDADEEAKMANFLKRTAASCAIAGALAVGAAAPSLAQVVVVEPYGGLYVYAAPYGYASPYSGYAYAPGYRYGRSWDYPAGYDSLGQSYSYRELGWQPGPPSGAPANPCWPSQRTHQRC